MKIKIIDALAIAAGILVGLAVAARWPAQLDVWEADPGYRWHDKTVTYSFANCPTTLDCATAYDTLRQAVAQWDAACGLTLEEAERNGDIVFSFSEHYIANGGLNTFSESDDIAAATYPCQWLVGGHCAGSSVVFDIGQVWHAGFFISRRGHADLRAVALHEIGHALGLPHNLAGSSVMYQYQGEGHRLSLSPGDVAMCRALYGE